MLRVCLIPSGCCHTCPTLHLTCSWPSGRRGLTDPIRKYYITHHIHLRSSCAHALTMSRFHSGAGDRSELHWDSVRKMGRTSSVVVSCRSRRSPGHQTSRLFSLELLQAVDWHGAGHSDRVKMTTSSLYNSISMQCSGKTHWKATVHLTAIKGKGLLVHVKASSLTTDIFLDLCIPLVKECWENNMVHF